MFSGRTMLNQPLGSWNMTGATGSTKCSRMQLPSISQPEAGTSVRGATSIKYSMAPRLSASCSLIGRLPTPQCKWSRRKCSITSAPTYTRPHRTHFAGCSANNYTSNGTACTLAAAGTWQLTDGTALKTQVDPCAAESVVNCLNTLAALNGAAIENWDVSLPERFQLSILWIHVLQHQHQRLMSA